MGIADTVADDSIFSPIVNAHPVSSFFDYSIASGTPGKMIQTLGLLSCLDNLRQNIK